ncbi:acyl dehydratase [Pseudomonas sp. GM33]|uniref:MaoC family dehydratase n=1 Tax=unclassified Pseudomonas TaxID=196821 RepID=UPI00026FF124|nr:MULTISPECIES: MaoC family dehydratase [unclassified Pseudomonas]AFY19494.1 MaoC-like dehydratase [Pseudomonas sp. UW4]EJM44177.1 acyl dehydratase [Pseudomonas sp. GM33]
MSHSLQHVKVGDGLPPLTLAAVDRTTLARFGCASGDLNPIHIDVDFARKAGMPDVFAHGMLSMAWLGRLLTQWVPQSRLRSFGVRFQGITHLGHVITCKGQVTEIVEVNGERCARVEVATVNQYGQVKIVGDALIAIAIG